MGPYHIKASVSLTTKYQILYTQSMHHEAIRRLIPKYV